MVQFRNGNQIINHYAADGRKMCTRYFTLTNPVVVPMGETRQWQFEDMVIDETATYYADNFEYTLYKDPDPATQSDLISLTRIHNVEGYISNLPSTLLSTQPTYCYNRKDHLGNNREVWQAPHVPKNVTTAAASTIQRTQYYPSGLPFGSLTDDYPEKQPYKYSGKGFITMHGYDIYDYGMRGYYAAIMRFTTPDPLAEKYYSVSPYAYCGNNPVRYVNPDGREISFSYEWEKDKENYVKNQNRGYNLIGVTINVTGKVINVSSNSDVNMKKIAQRISDKISSPFSRTVGDVTFPTKVNLIVANSMDDVLESDHVFAIADIINVFEGHDISGGANYIGGKVAFIGVNYFTGLWNSHFGEGSWSVAHEFGHLAGLRYRLTK